MRLIAVKHLRVCGRATISVGLPTGFPTLTTGTSGEPLPAQVERTVHTRDGEPVLHRAARSTEDGLLGISLPARNHLPHKGLQHEAAAARNGAREAFTTFYSHAHAKFRRIVLRIEQCISLLPRVDSSTIRIGP